MTTKTDITPLPCPFCGGNNIVNSFVETYSTDSSYDVFGCEDCGARFEDGNVEMWNRRAAVQADRKRRGEPDYFISACYFPKAGEVELSWERKEDGAKATLTCKVTPEQGSAIANVVWPCVYYTASPQPAEPVVVDHGETRMDADFPAKYGSISGKVVDHGSEPVKVPSDAEVLSLAYDVGALPEQMTDVGLYRFARAILSRYGQPAASAEPIGEAKLFQPAATEEAFTYCIFDARLVPAGTKLFARAAPVAAQPSVLEGWKLVPVEPTEAMIEAADESDKEYTLRHCGNSNGGVPINQDGYDHWVAMLAAAPTPPAVEESFCTESTQKDLQIAAESAQDREDADRYRWLRRDKTEMQERQNRDARAANRGNRARHVRGTFRRGHRRRL